MPALKITKAAVDGVDVPDKSDIYYWDTRLSGFGLRVTPKGVRSYVIQYRMKGAPARRMTLGIHGSPWTPDKAREAAEEILLGVKRGVDPVEQSRKKVREARTLHFEGYVSRFVDGCLKQDWADSWADAERILKTYAVPKLKGRPLPAIERSEIREVTDALRDTPALARKAHAVLSRLFNWAVEEGDMPKALNPMAGMKPPPKPKDRKRVLSPDEIAAAWRASYKLHGPFGPFVRLLFATLQRRNEVAGLPWKEVDQQRSLWKIDGARAKNDEDHLVPLNALAMTELAALGWSRRGLALTTTGTTAISGFSRMKAQLDKHMLAELQALADKRSEALGEDPHPVTLEPWRLHDIRRSGTTAMQSLGVPVEHTEAVLNHKEGEAQAGIRKVYNLWKYEPEKRRALDLWGDYLARLATAEGSNVVSLSRAA